ncbi:hypothetical protein [Streptomyces sp. NPDC088246]|uniref:hypothetical protein n=1 Tax=Streptomyces sp. NPDC088246 TaxID=3365842 RepID=UPI00381ABCAE
MTRASGRVGSSCLATGGWGISDSVPVCNPEESGRARQRATDDPFFSSVHRAP